MCANPAGRQAPDDTDISVKVEKLEEEIARLHSIFESKGVNSHQTTDIYGREFAMPVDKEHKAVALNLLNVSVPHMRAFHSSWFGFFSTFFSTFAANPLGFAMEKETSLNLTPIDVSTGNILSLSSNIIMRCVTGYLCDIFGPRKALAGLLIVTSPAILGMCFVQNAAGYLGCRALIGFGLATFVPCQVWCSQMFAKKVVGTANATSAGWGNLGGGVTQLVMPLVWTGIFSGVTGTIPEREDMAWRLAYILPLGMHLIGALFVLSGRDLPDGNIKELESSGAKQKSKGSVVLRTGLSNVNAWILTATYGQCFGVELAMNSLAFKYFYTYHGIVPTTAGILASLYGMMNLFARSLGGMLSDWANKRFGMRGRLWACWAVQTLEGLMCVFMGMITIQYDAPWKTAKVGAATMIDDEWIMVPNMTVPACGAKFDDPGALFREAHDIKAELVMMYDPPTSDTGANCISHAGKTGAAVFVMILFSLCVQASEGLHYGIVPYVSRPALGVVSGMVGAGGNLGAVIALRSFFFGGINRTDQGFIYLGIMVMSVTATMMFIYFPDQGGMWVPKGGLGSFDPQLIKPPSDYRGSDSVVYDNIDVNGKAKPTSTTTATEPP
jgi:NNP family nitrate/nitrite transporter-like MFS transporter